MTQELETQIAICVESIANVMKNRKAYALKDWKILSVYILKIICKYCKSVENKKIFIILYNYLEDEPTLLLKIYSIFDFEFLPEFYFSLQKLCIRLIENDDKKYVDKILLVLCNQQCDWQPVIKILSESKENLKMAMFIKNQYIIIKYVYKYQMNNIFKRIIGHTFTLLGHYMYKNLEQSVQNECINLILSEIFNDLNSFYYVNDILSEFISTYIKNDSMKSFLNFMPNEHIQLIESLRKSLLNYSIELFISLLQQYEDQINIKKVFLLRLKVFEIWYYFIQQENKIESSEYFKLINLYIGFLQKFQNTRYNDGYDCIFIEHIHSITKIMKSFVHVKKYLTDMMLDFPLKLQLKERFFTSIGEFIHENFRIDQEFVDLIKQDNLSLEQILNCAYILSSINCKNVDYEVIELEFTFLKIFTNLATKSNKDDISLKLSSKFFENIIKIISKKSDVISINEAQMTRICQILKEKLNTPFEYCDVGNSRCNTLSYFIYFIRKGSKMNISHDKYKDIYIGGIISRDSLAIFYASLLKILFKFYKDQTYYTNHDKLLQILIMDLDNYSNIDSLDISNVISNIKENIQDDNIVSLFWKRMIVEFEDISPEDHSFVFFMQHMFAHPNHISELIHFYGYTCIKFERYIDISFRMKPSWIVRILDICCVCIEINDAKKNFSDDIDNYNNNNSYETITKFIQSKFVEISVYNIAELLNNNKYSFYITRLCITIVKKPQDESMSCLLVQILKNIESFITDQSFQVSIVQQWSIFMLMNALIDLLCKNDCVDTSLITSIQKFVSSILNLEYNYRYILYSVVNKQLLSIDHVKKFQQFIFFSTCLLCSIQDNITVPEMRDEKFIYGYFIDAEILRILKLETLQESLLSNKTTTNYWSKEEIIAINDKLRNEWKKIYISFYFK